jgi:hypothetical protein
MRGRSIWQEAAELHRNLCRVQEHALSTYALRGRRPEHERDSLASMLRDALETHTSARLTAARGAIFEDLLCQVFEILGEPHQDLHTLAERALKRKLVSHPSPGVTLVETYE